VAEQMTVDTGALRDTASQVGGHKGTAATLASTAAAAEVTPKSWGLVGLVTLYPAYVGSLATVTEHLGKLATAVGDASDTLTACAEIYEEAEKGFVDVITQAADELAAVQASPTVRA
jgi:uncharacterized protein YukE